MEPLLRVIGGDLPALSGDGAKVESTIRRYESRLGPLNLSSEGVFRQSLPIAVDERLIRKERCNNEI